MSVPIPSPASSTPAASVALQLPLATATPALGSASSAVLDRERLNLLLLRRTQCPALAFIQALCHIVAAAGDMAKQGKKSHVRSRIVEHRALATEFQASHVPDVWLESLYEFIT
mmetsp:Transcript_62002/g.119504  ORF Transcript_62002/g.119504 Transcript_62002/m.119504 type:complete len:114 (+) Transcript_62002:31-372(+)